MKIIVYAYDDNHDILLTAERIANKSARSIIERGMKVTKRKTYKIQLECPAKGMQAHFIADQFRRRMHRIHEWAKDDGSLYDYYLDLEWEK